MQHLKKYSFKELKKDIIEQLDKINWELPT